MANKALKGLTIKIGADTTDLHKSLESVEKQSKSLSGELGEINKLLKLDPSNTDLLAQKQKVLAEAISKTQDKLGTLKEAEAQVQAQFERGEVSEAQYRALQREIIATENKLAKYKSAAKETAEAVDKLGKASNDAANGLDDEAAAAEQAENATEDLDDASNDLAKGGLAAATTAALAAAAAVAAIAEESREYRTEMGKLDTAFQSVGFSGETATNTYKKLQSVIGETDQSVEAAQQIALLAKSEQDAAEWADLAAGVIGRFGDALQPETFYEAANETIKLGTATGAYTQLLEGCGESVDEFNEGLAACNTAQEKQEYMLDVTSRLLGSAAVQYRKNNAEVIRSNEATEKWNESLADMGEQVEPVMTDVRALGATLLKDAKEPLKDIAGFIRQSVIPAIKNVSSWCRENTPVIKSGLVGVTAALVAYKVATIAAEVAHKGLKGAILATTAAQKALQLVQSATPWGLAATAIAGVSIALATYVRSTKEAKQSVEVLTAEEKALVAAAKEASDAFREQTAAIDAEETSILSSMGHTEALAKELIGLADASGKVQESDEARAQFILGELNEALGTEYSMTNGLIQNYGDLEASIYDLIKAKTAEYLLEKNREAYIAAVEKEAEAWDALIATEKDYKSQIKATAEARIEYRKAQIATNQAISEGADNVEYYRNLETKAYNQKDKAIKALRDKMQAYDEAKADYVSYQETILQYQTAEEQALQGNYQATQEILAGKGQEYRNFTGVVDDETGKVLGVLDKEATDAGIKAEWTKKNFEDGIAGFTETMATEAAQGYSDALSAFDTAYDDAYAVGSDLGTGLVDGMNDWLPTVADTMASAVNAALEAAREAADSHSPARKTIELGEDMGEGEKIGIENKTKDVKRAAAEQVSAALDAYSLQDVEGQRALRSVTQQQFYNYSVEQTAVANANTPMLEKILTAIEQGHVLVLDSDAIVGGTADRMDRALGRRKILASGGVIL